MDAASTDNTFSQLPYVQQALQDAENLLEFASESGVAVDDPTKRGVLDARAAFAKGLDEATTANLLTSLANLAATLSPVSPQSLGVCVRGKPPLTPHSWWARSLAVIIVVYSTLSFVTSGISASIHADITTANALAVKLTSEFPGSTATSVPQGLNAPDVVKDLQQYATTIRNIYSESLELSIFVHPYDFVFHRASVDPYYNSGNTATQLRDRWELPLPLTDYAQAALARTETYQTVRYSAQHMADDVNFYYGAISSCVLPVLYALLGTFAYLLRTFELQVCARSYVPSAVDTARFVIAAIGGAVVGLFSNFTTGEGFKASPLALAFLVGYAVDVFYAFLETLIQSFTKTALPSAPSAQNSASPPGPANAASITST